MTREETQRILAIIASTYPNFKVENKGMTVDVWHKVLENDSYEKIEASLYAYIRKDNSGFAPTIGQLLNSFEEITDDTTSGAEAWSMVYKAICNSAYESEKEFDNLPVSVQKAVGSPQDLKRMATTPSLNVEVEKSHFLRVYSAVKQREKNERMVGISLVNSIEQHARKELTSGE